MVAKIKDRSGEEFHVLEGWFGREGTFEPSVVDGTVVIVPGCLGDIPVIQLPASASAEDYERVSRVIQEVTNIVPLVVTPNVSIMKMRRVSGQEAARLVQKSIREAANAHGDGNGFVSDGQRTGDAVAGITDDAPSDNGDDAVGSGTIEGGAAPEG